MFNGLDVNLHNLSRLSNAVTRSISPENFTGEPGKGGMATEGGGARVARELGQSWKVSPFVVVQPRQTFTLAQIDGVRRNPYDEVECGHHYARSMSSWMLLLALTGAHAHAGRGEMSFAPCWKPQRTRTSSARSDRMGKNG